MIRVKFLYWKFFYSAENLNLTILLTYEKLIFTQLPTGNTRRHKKFSHLWIFFDVENFHFSVQRSREKGIFVYLSDGVYLVLVEFVLEINFIIEDNSYVSFDIPENYFIIKDFNFGDDLVCVDFNHFVVLYVKSIKLLVFIW